jgi:HEAT repeat protein
MTVLASIASYRTWIDEYLEEPHKRRLALEALDAFERLENATRVSANQIVPILDAAKCRFVRVWEIGADSLNRLAVRHPSAQDALGIMLRDRNADVRFQAIALLGISSLPQSFAESLVRIGLNDKSYQVRGKVAEAACQLGLRALVPQLKESLNVEKHAIARQSLEFAIALLRDGFLLQRTDGKLTNVWVKRERGRGGHITAFRSSTSTRGRYG